MKMKILDRKEYKNRLIRLQETEKIKIISGIRGAGKSELLHSYQKWIESHLEGANILYLDMEDAQNAELKDGPSLLSHIEKNYEEKRSNFLIVEEVQHCKNFEKAMQSVYERKMFNIYLSSSNASFLYEDKTAFWDENSIELPIYPFSLSEYLRYYERKDPSSAILPGYLKYGGLSATFRFKFKEDKTEYIKELYNKKIKKDLRKTYGIKDPALMDSLLAYLMLHISASTSASKISNLFKQNNLETNHITIGKYLQYLCATFLFFKVKRYDIRKKVYLETADKYYMTDLGFRFALLEKEKPDWKGIYENLVAIEIRRRGYEIYVGKLYQKEINFVAMREKEKLYIQVTDEIEEEDKLAKALSPLRAIKDFYPKLLIANTGKDEFDVDGIRILDLTKWLMEG
jgi:hypothetical protein